MENLPLILKNIAQAKRVAIAIPQDATVDAFCAAIALQAKTEGMIFSVAPTPELLFLDNVPGIYSALSGNDQLAIKVSNKNAQPKELRYEKADSGLTIFISPNADGQFKQEDVSVLPAAGNFDLVIIIGAANFEALGKLYTENPKLFYDTPHINIDNNPANEFYGTLNFVNPAASSLSEVVMDIVEGMNEGLKGDTVVTSLLAGIIAQTSSFRDPKTTPSALQKASRLVNAGARQKDIIQHLFKTKSLPLLQLWGRALARLTARPDKKALAAILTASDLQKTQNSVDSLATVVRDILEMVTGYTFIALLAEIPEGQGVQIILAGLPFEDLEGMAKTLTQNSAKLNLLFGQYHYVSLHVAESLSDVQSKLMQLIENRSSVL